MLDVGKGNVLVKDRINSCGLLGIRKSAFCEMDSMLFG